MRSPWGYCDDCGIEMEPFSKCLSTWQYHRPEDAKSDDDEAAENDDE